MSGHTSVLYHECLDALRLKSGGVYIDGTLGGGGHSEGILKSGAQLIAFDKDGDAIERCKKRLAEYAGSFTLVRSDFKDVKRVLKDMGISQVDGAMLDLGVSSFQLDEQERGFSYNKDAPLDMRMDRRSELNAHKIVNTYSEQQLKRIIYEYGEEKFAPRIARGIIAARPIDTTAQLAEIVKTPSLRRRGEPAGILPRELFRRLE